ncbi:MAG: glucosaminidase domain-containing protein [Herpetosiphon sp.]
MYDKEMVSRRKVLGFGAASLLGLVGLPDKQQADAQSPRRVLLPMVAVGQADMPILGAGSGTPQQAQTWLAAHASVYTANDVWEIVHAYQQIGDAVGMDWFLAIGQMALETGSLTSWWSQRPRRNSAGIGVTGREQAGSVDRPPAPTGWSWDDQRGIWREGLSFDSWTNDAVPAHLGRLLAYALRDDQATPAQQELIRRALAYRRLSASLRGVAVTITSLNGKWAVPGTEYGQHIVALVNRMRSSPS